MKGLVKIDKATTETSVNPSDKALEVEYILKSDVKERNGEKVDNNTGVQNDVQDRVQDGVQNESGSNLEKNIEKKSEENLEDNGKTSKATR